MADTKDILFYTNDEPKRRMIDELQRLNTNMPRVLIEDLVNMYEGLGANAEEVFTEVLNEVKPIDALTKDDRKHGEALETLDFKTKEESEAYMKNKYPDIITDE